MSDNLKQTEYGLMQSNLAVAKLSELCVPKIGVQTGPFGSQLHKEDYVESGTPIITVEHLDENRISHINTPFVSDEDKKRLQKYQLMKGDIVFSRVGSVDRRAIVREEEDGWLFSGRCLRVRADPKKINSEYLSYFFGLYGFKQYIRNIAVGATMPSINTKILSDVPIYFHKDLEYQNNVVKILSSIDKKIQLNKETNQTLEAIAQALFKSWFIDFDPVRAKAEALANGKTKTQATIDAMKTLSSKTSDQLTQLAQENPKDYQQLQTTAEAFPSGFDDMGIPLGWEVESIGNIATITKGKSYKSSELCESKTALVTLKSFNRGGGYRLDGLKEYTGKYKSEQEVFAGDLIVAYTDVTQAADVIGKPAMVMSDSRYEHLVISLDVAVVRPKEIVYRYFLYCLAKTNAFQSHTEAFSTGTTVLHLAKDAVPKFKFTKPNKIILEGFSNIVSPMFTDINGNIEENKMLKATRDALLPKLLSGEIQL